LDYKNTDNTLAGSRFYLSYGGSAPTPANCATLAGNIAAAWEADIAPLVDQSWSLVEVDVLDIATYTGLSGQWTGNNAGTRPGTPLPAQCSVGVEFNIARRYRGGKPRMFFPPGNTGDTADNSHWLVAYYNQWSASMGTFIAACVASPPGAIGPLAHVNLSYFDGYNTNTPPWRGPGHKYPPKYRPTALHDPVLSYSGKAVIASQKKRRTATSY
jgi:hypothetical protein